MTILNPSFEDGGIYPGDAEHWTLSTYTSLKRIAGFGPEPFRAWEDFERWSELLVELEHTETGFFDPLPEGYEDFEEAWQNDLYLTELPTGLVESALFGGDTVEDMENGWNNASYATDWEDVSSAVGQFDGEPQEDFEESWRSNQDFDWDWSTVSAQTAMFDAGADDNEDFENDWTPAVTI